MCIRDRDADGASCLREILIEVPEKLTVRLEGSVKAKLVFPEFFEESVENTPARILVIHTHGSGMNYRNCFYDRKFDFRAYDACFYHAKAEEDFDTVLEMTQMCIRDSPYAGRKVSEFCGKAEANLSSEIYTFLFLWF